jgi:hypothetical protein
MSYITTPEKLTPILLGMIKDLTGFKRTLLEIGYGKAYPRAYHDHGDGTLEIGILGEDDEARPFVIVRLLYPDGADSDDFKPAKEAWKTRHAPDKILYLHTEYRYYYSIPSDHPSNPPIYCYTKD